MSAPSSRLVYSVVANPDGTLDLVEMAALRVVRSWRSADDLLADLEEVEMDAEAPAID